MILTNELVQDIVKVHPHTKIQVHGESANRHTDTHTYTQILLPQLLMWKVMIEIGLCHFLGICSDDTYRSGRVLPADL